MNHAAGRMIVGGLLLLLAGCADTGYYLQSVQGQFSIMHKARDIDDVLSDKNTSPQLHRQLQRVKEIREFAFTQLALPRSDSYTDYADLGRPYVLKNLFATDEFSIRLQHWCYPLVGCAGYRGFFDEQRQADFTDKLHQQGKDVYVANVAAYSTLGWFDDPVLNTFVYWPDYRLAGLIFHELAHQRLYVDNDTTFNESFAIAVQQVGVERWLAQHGELKRLQSYRQYLKNRAAVVDLIERARQRLDGVYSENLSSPVKRQRKQQIFRELKQQYRQLAAGFTVKDGFARWFDGKLNNARLASVSTYHSKVKLFRSLLDAQDGDFERFYRAVEDLARNSRPPDGSAPES